MMGHGRGSSPNFEDEDQQEKLLASSRPSVVKFLNPPQRFIQVPSHGSIYTEFYPPDLSQFNIDQCKSDNQQTFFMTSAWRVISFFFVVFILPTLLISIPLYARYHVYHTRSLSLTDGDMRSFHSDVSSFWCKGQKVTSNGTFEAYLTEKAKRVKKYKRTSKLSAELLLTGDDVDEWGIYLIKGSYFTFSACSRWPGGTLLVVQGEYNMRKCFYKEDRGLHQIKDEEQAVATPPVKKNTHRVKRNYEFEDTGGEVFDDGEGDQYTDDIIQRLYSSKRSTDGRPNDKDQLKLHPKGENPIPEENKKTGKEDHLDLSKPATSQETSTDNPMRVINLDINPFSANTRHISANQGLLMFNISDTLDVTTGNSSFSSSEEFLQQCSDTIVTVDLVPQPHCSKMASINSSDTSIRWRFRANKTDSYYFIFTSDNSIEANVVSFRLLLERRVYDVSEPLLVCQNRSECIFPFSFMKSEGVIVDFNEHYENISQLEHLHNYELTAVCQPRSLVYTVFILLVPFIIVMFAFR